MMWSVFMFQWASSGIKPVLFLWRSIPAFSPGLVRFLWQGCVNSKWTFLIHQALTLLLLWQTALDLGQIIDILNLAVNNWEVWPGSWSDKNQLCLFMESLAGRLFLKFFSASKNKVCLLIYLLIYSFIHLHVCIHVFPICSPSLFFFSQKTSSFTLKQYGASCVVLANSASCILRLQVWIITLGFLIIIEFSKHLKIISRNFHSYVMRLRQSLDHSFPEVSTDKTWVSICMFFYDRVTT